ncbi:hypothetical protein QFW77_02635 [Luteimonas sp. RD2P54]|uniref:CXXC-20-CXXC protein n=1 Tax=Luteimonas endophytica TaxID=3042023 RepID=A0ABT6J4Z3_9GAMM|nr:hypothetical protein [Luteimonas endophytica]MDH5821892.1 hypothetical protein [Luteimonas endophytica]
MHPTLCPHCGQRCMDFWSKIALGPARKKKCQTCGNMVGVPWLQSSLHLLGMGLIPLLICVMAIAMRDSSGWLSLALPAGGILAGVAVELWLYCRFVPLVARAP